MEKAKLTKAEIIDNIKAKHHFIARDDIHRVLDGLFEELKAGLAAGKIIELRGLGTFEVRARVGKENARNPKTGETVSVDSHGVAFFRAGKELQQSVWDIRNND